MHFEQNLWEQLLNSKHSENSLSWSHRAQKKFPLRYEVMKSIEGASNNGVVVVEVSFGAVFGEFGFW